MKDGVVWAYAADIAREAGGGPGAWSRLTSLRAWRSPRHEARTNEWRAGRMAEGVADAGGRSLRRGRSAAAGGVLRRLRGARRKGRGRESSLRRLPGRRGQAGRATAEGEGRSRVT